MKRQTVRALAVLFFLAAISSWFLKVERERYFYGYYNQPIHKRVINVWEQIPEDDARIILQGLAKERGKLLAEGKMNARTNHDLERKLFDLGDHVVYKEEAKPHDYELYEEWAPQFYWEMSNLQIAIYRDREQFCASPEDKALLMRLWDEDIKKHPPAKFEPTERAEVMAIGRDRSARSLILTLLALLALLYARVLKINSWQLRELIGYGKLRFSLLGTLFVFAFAAGPAVAQQLLVKVKKADQTQEQVVSNQTPDPLKGGNDSVKTITLRKQLVDKLTVWVWGDIGDVTRSKESHDAQVIEQYVDHTGFTLLQQNRRSSDGKSITGNITAGWTFRSKWFDQTVTVGPAFNYAVRGQDSGYNRQMIVFLPTNIRTPYVWFSSFVKIMAPTDKKVCFGDRHVQTIRGPPERTPRVLQGIALQMENWHVNGPGGGHWNELMFGPMLNIGEIVGKPKSALAWFSVYPSWDLCRPLPDRQRSWDVRIQYKRTFAFSHE